MFHIRSAQCVALPSMESEVPVQLAHMGNAFSILAAAHQVAGDCRVSRCLGSKALHARDNSFFTSIVGWMPATTSRLFAGIG